MERRYGKYQLLERIGVGGMAEVFKAKVHGAEGFERLIAIKRILPHLVEDDDFVNMFVDEAKIAVRLNHPNIVAIHDLGRIEDTLFIAMEFVLGRDLRAIYDYEKERGGVTPVGVACHVVMKMCEALHHAHFATGPEGQPLQVIHRDVSPQNVLLSFDGEVKVADFGLAKARGRMVQTQAGVVKGKLAYMSPEQLKGGEIDHRVDVFGLGIVLYELLTGERLFLGPSDMDTLRRVYEARVPPMREINPEIHPDLEVIVRRALAKDRDERYQTALDLHDDLQHFVYSNGCYANTSALRKYVREAFPDVAPAPEGLPPFAERPASVHPPPVPDASVRPTKRPLHREPQPPVASEEILRPPPLADDLEGLLEEVELIEDGPATEMPPPAPSGAVVARPILDTGRPPPPESSQVQPSEHAFPSSPPGVYDDEPVHSTVSDTSPAPAPAADLSFDFDEWEENTVFEPMKLDQMQTLLDAAEEQEEKKSADEPEDDWGDSTIIVDPRSSGGQGGQSGHG